MLYAIMSDIHANPSALEKVLVDAKEQGAEKVICLGDVVGYGPDPVEAVSLCRESCDVVLMGNHDAAVAGLTRTDNFIAFAQDGVRRDGGVADVADAARERQVGALADDFAKLAGEEESAIGDLFEEIVHAEHGLRISHVDCK